MNPINHIGRNAQRLITANWLHIQQQMPLAEVDVFNFNRMDMTFAIKVKTENELQQLGWIDIEQQPLNRNQEPINSLIDWISEQPYKTVVFNNSQSGEVFSVTIYQNRPYVMMWTRVNNTIFYALRLISRHNNDINDNRIWGSLYYHQIQQQHLQQIEQFTFVIRCCSLMSGCPIQ